MRLVIKWFDVALDERISYGSTLSHALRNRLVPYSVFYYKWECVSLCALCFIVCYIYCSVTLHVLPCDPFASSHRISCAFAYKSLALSVILRNLCIAVLLISGLLILNQVKSNQIKSSQVKSSQIKLSEVKSSQMK